MNFRSNDFNAPEYVLSHSPSSSGRLDRELQSERMSSSGERGKYSMFTVNIAKWQSSHTIQSICILPAMITEARWVGFFPFLILYWFISSSICWSLCMASRQFLLLFFLTVLHSSGSFASFLAASTIFCCRANLLSRFLRKGSYTKYKPHTPEITICRKNSATHNNIFTYAADAMLSCPANK